jgi:hypothetical protein
MSPQILTLMTVNGAPSPFLSGPVAPVRTGRHGRGTLLRTVAGIWPFLKPRNLGAIRDPRYLCTSEPRYVEAYDPTRREPVLDK